MNRGVLTALLFGALLAAAGALLLVLLVPHEGLYPYYRSELQAHLFGTFLSVGGLLFSFKTFILVKMKEAVYDHPSYGERLRNQRQATGRTGGRYYEGLWGLRSLLSMSIYAAFGTALMQLSLGLVAESWVVYLCVPAAFFTLALFACSLYAMNQNIRTWFEYAELDKGRNGARD